ncbi:MAG: acylneuraminate cytidylyltransferase family protein [Bdellovibrionales bacterium]
MEFLALIPLRGGSKSIPGKNIREFGGKPLFYWVTRACIDSEIFKEVWISSDSDEILEMAQSLFGSDIKLAKRNKELALDTTSTEDVILDFMQNRSFDVLSLVQATSPLTRAEDFINAKNQFVSGDYDSLVTGVQFQRFIWSKKANKAVNYNPQKRPRRQDMNDFIMENGAFYFTNKKVLEETKCRIGSRPCVFEMHESTSIEMDEISDWNYLENLMNSKLRQGE